MSRAIDIMTATPATLPITSTVADAVQVLHTLDVRHVPIVDARGAIAGMFSDRDLRALSIPRTVNDAWFGEFRIALETKLASVMSADVITIEEDTETTEIIELMLEHKVGALPVLDADGLLAGIVSYVDVLRALYSLETEAVE
jgi:CBS-domain-containing membrane protein